MRQHLNNPWVVLGLCIVAVVVLYLNTDGEVVRQTLPPRTLPLGIPRTVGIKPLNNQTSIMNKTELGWTTAIERDPFAPITDRSSGIGDGADEEERQYAGLSPSQTAFPSLELSAVALEPEPKVAMINRKLVEEGDRVEGLRVAKIDADGVWLHGPSGPHHVGFERSDDQPTGLGKNQETKRRRVRPSQVPDTRRSEDQRTKKNAVLKDGRDCSIRSTCS